MENTSKKGNKPRYFFKLYPLNVPAPEVENILGDVRDNILFIQHVTLYPSSVSWKLYRYGVNRFNYRSFIITFAHQLGMLDISSCFAQQFELNARRLLRRLRVLNIKLSEKESEVLILSSHFSSWNSKDTSRYEMSTEILFSLFTQYLV